MKHRTCIVLLLITLGSGMTFGQSLQPGFDKAEYLEMLRILARVTADSSYYNKFESPVRYTLQYESPILGLDHLWQLWTNDHTAVIAVRGTTKNSVSWLANFYAAMVPAKGVVQLDAERAFSYDLTDHPQAAVHVGWLTATGFMYEDIRPWVDTLVTQGIQNIIVLGHSQGGGIAYLLTAHLYSLQRQGRLSGDIRLKTYCSAAPKPGNLYFAYAYEAMTQGGWAYNVVNTADWVPETPLSIQTLEDFNTTNPFLHARTIIRQQKFPKDIAMRYVYGRLHKPLIKARKRYQHYLGTVASKSVGRALPGYAHPGYFDSNHYVRTGNTIVLVPDQAYFELYPEDPNDIFRHHLIAPYMFMAEKL